MASCAVRRGGGHVTSLILLSLLVLAAEANKDVTQVGNARVPPQMELPEKAKTQYERVNSEVILTCKASGIPKPSYQWLYNRMPIDPVKHPEITYDGFNGTLRIARLTEDNEGSYHCEASNSIQGGHVAVAKSPAIRVFVGRVKDWNVNTEEDKSARYSEYNYGFLTCDKNLPEFFGSTEFKWFIVKKAENTQQILSSDERRFIDQKGTLHFSYVLQKDELHGNEFYACGMSNAVEGFIRRGRLRSLTVTGGTPGTRKAVLKYPKTDVKPVYEHILGNEARLDCFMSGYTNKSGKIKLHEITWLKDDRPITTGGRFTIKENTRVLHITDLQEEDEGDYTCKSGSAEGVLFLNVTSPPIWLKKLESVTVTEDEDAHFHCDARSARTEDPPSSPMWERNGGELKSGHLENKYKFSKDRKTLTVVGVKKKDDIACFQCYVRNSVDSVFSGACLNVVLPIKIKTEPKAVQEVTQGDIVNLTVVAEGDPLYHLRYEWFFKNTTFIRDKAPPFVQYDPITKVAFINTSGLTDNEMGEIAGLYRRDIITKTQEQSVEVEVIFKDEPVVVPVAEAGFDYWIIGLIIGILLIIIVILLICCVICRRKMLEGDYPVDRKEVAAGHDPEKELLDSGFHDLSRADYEFPPEKKSPNLDFDDNMPLGDDESFGSEYGGEEATAFNEDGSFIGVYSKGNKKGGPPGYQAAESNV